MTTRHDPGTCADEAARAGQRHGHGGHGWMIACCLPMLAIASILVATGVVRPFFLVFAVGCPLMMAMMMGGMGRGGGGDRS